MPQALPSPGDEIPEVPENYKEGSELPVGWPAAQVPLPEGAAPVASLGNVTVPGQTGEASSVLFSSAVTPDGAKTFWQRELPKKGWTVLDTQSGADFLLITAQGNGYVGIFGAGEALGPPETSTGQKISLQVVLTKGDFPAP